eukprot:TRINITY_DN331_c0_g1_i1.p1 TRINITY_DN331_c0_g1~~TRINITY_DN331_c0_g1_i1.p1  ORF type:complete len:160 (+),score=37.49 TRINITY_DN331_c0_g1_i1:222-701(+)
MRIEACYFCGAPIYPAHGITFVRNDAKVFRFCKSKCHKHFKMKHNPLRAKYTKAYRRSRGKDMTVDKTFDFEKRRNRPVRYDRELFGTTLRAMKRILDIRAKRVASHHAKRMEGNKKREKELALREIRESIDIIRAPNARTPSKIKIGAVKVDKMEMAS